MDRTEPPAKRIRCDDTDYTSDSIINNYSTNAFSMEGGFDRAHYEDLNKLKQFQILDEVGNDEESQQEESDDSEEIPDDEIERMLDEDLPEKFKGPRKEKEKSYFTKQKIMLEEKGTNHFEVLPVDWLMVTHNSGIPVYLHRTLRVVTLSKPYFLGTGSVRKHDIPVSAIPCYAYKRALEVEQREAEINKKIAEQISNGSLTPNTIKVACPSKENNIKEKWLEIAEKCKRNKNKKKKEVENRTNDEEDENLKNVNENDKKYRKQDACNKEIKADETDLKIDLIEHMDILKKNISDIGDSDAKIKEESKIEPKQTDIEKDILESKRPVILPGGLVLPVVRVESVQENWKNQHLTHEQVTEYCKKVFKFKTVSVVHFKHWSDRRRYARAKKAMQPPTMSKGTKIISIPIPSGKEEKNVPGILGRPKKQQQEWIMNMNGQSYISILTDFVRRALQNQPTYEFRQLENSATPYEATVLIDGMRYGVGLGSSKRQAKLAAARESILVLIPEMKEQIEKEDLGANGIGEPDLEFFDMVGIEDPRIIGFCNTTMEPPPHSILRVCLLRNFGAGERHIQCEMNKLKDKDIEFKMTVGKHTATVVCKNKKIGKQRASQAILQALHPHVKSWGSLLRLYGSSSMKSCRVRKMEEQEITLLQDKAQVNQPNYAILEKLRLEMQKIHGRDAAVVPIGTLVVEDGLPNLSGSRLNNVEI